MGRLDAAADTASRFSLSGAGAASARTSSEAGGVSAAAGYGSKRHRDARPFDYAAALRRKLSCKAAGRPEEAARGDSAAEGGAVTDRRMVLATTGRARACDASSGSVVPWQHAASGQRQPIIQVTFAERREPAFDVAEQVQAAVKRAISEAVVPLARARQPAVLAHPVRAIGGQRGALPLAQAPGGVVADARLAAAPQAQRPTPPPSLSAQLLSAGLQEAAQATALAHPRITQQLVRERAQGGSGCPHHPRGDRGGQCDPRDALAGGALADVRAGACVWLLCRTAAGCRAC